MDAIGPIVRTQRSRRQRDSRRGDPISPLDRRTLPFEPAATSARLGWVGPQAAHFRATPAFELNDAVCTHHHFALFSQPPQQFDARFAGVTRHVPPSAGSIIFVPAGSPVRTRSSGHKDELHIFLEPGVIERVAAKAFEFDPARVSIPRPTAGNTPNSGPRC